MEVICLRKQTPDPDPDRILLGGRMRSLAALVLHLQLRHRQTSILLVARQPIQVAFSLVSRIGARALILNAMHDLKLPNVSDECQLVHDTNRRLRSSDKITMCRCLATWTRTHLGNRSSAVAGPRL